MCWVNLPKHSLGDIQVASEYAAWAVGYMHRHSGERVDVLGHSQGGLEPRWAIKYFATGRFVDDYVGLASPNHGTIVADASAAGGLCFPACWQMRTTARFIAALNSHDETPEPISYTNIYTATDELVQPVGTQALQGGSNVLLQDLCPGRPVDHAAIVDDGVTYLLVLDALSRDGAADPTRMPADLCARTTMPGSGPRPDGFEPPNFSDGGSSDHEPRLKPYAR